MLGFVGDTKNLSKTVNFSKHGSLVKAIKKLFFKNALQKRYTTRHMKNVKLPFHNKGMGIVLREYIRTS